MAVDTFPDSAASYSLLGGATKLDNLKEAGSVLRRTAYCWKLWDEMVDERGLLPNDVTQGSMINASVEAQRSTRR